MIRFPYSEMPLGLQRIAFYAYAGPYSMRHKIAALGDALFAFFIQGIQKNRCTKYSKQLFFPLQYGKRGSKITLLPLLSKQIRNSVSRKIKHSALHLLVEMARVELASESISTRVSPSAADDLDFASLTVRQQTDRDAISLFPCGTENSRRVCLYSRCQISGLQVNRS